MQIYLSGNPVTLTIPLVDRGGNTYSPSAVSYDVIDQTGTIQVALTPITTFNLGDTSVGITIPAAQNTAAIIDPTTITNNQVDEFSTRAIRTVRLYLTVGGDSVLLTSSYAIEPTDPLIVGMNSFQSFAQAELTSMDIPTLTAWHTAMDSQKFSAMIEARRRLCQLNYWLLNSNVNWGQDNMNFIPEGAYQSPYAGINNLFIFNGNISLLTPTQYGALPIRFKTALAFAQVAEADNILGGNPVVSRRQDGLLSESVGESKQVFRQGRPLNLPVCRRALEYVSQFVTFAKRTGRG